MIPEHHRVYLRWKDVVYYVPAPKNPYALSPPTTMPATNALELYGDKMLGIYAQDQTAMENSDPQTGLPIEV
jgi:hypothetical protein